MINLVDKRSNNLILLAFMLAHAANDGFNGLFPPLLPLIREYFDLSYAQLGGFLTLFRFFGNFLQLPVGYLAHLLPSLTIIVSGLLWLSTGMLLATFAGSYWTLASSFSLAGIGRSSYHPLGLSLLSRVFPQERLGRAVGLHMGASSVAHLLAPSLVILLGTRFGWYWPIRLWSFYGIIAAFLLLAMLGSLVEKESRPEGKALRLPFISSSMAFYLLSRICWAVARSGMTAFLPLFLIERARFSIKSATLCYMAMHLMDAMGRPLVGALSDKMGERKPVMLAEYAICGVLFLILTIFRAKAVVLSIVLGIGLFSGTVAVVAQTYVIEMIPSEQRERTLGFVFTIHTLGFALAPVILGVVADYFGLAESFIALPLLMGMSLFFMLFAKEG